MTRLDPAGEARTTTKEAAWREAAVFGALWGALEVTLGVFLHAVKLPFCGLLLTACGICLLVAGRTVFPRRGFVLRAGLVCAGVKLLSPGGNPLGPMVGIAVEAALLECAFLVLPGRFASVAAVVGGGLAALWTVAQSFLQHVLLLGSTVIDLYAAMLRQSGAALGIAPGWGLSLVITFLCVVAGLGGASGLAGLRLGRASLSRLAAGVVDTAEEQQAGGSAARVSASRPGLPVVASPEADASRRAAVLTTRQRTVLLLASAAAVACQVTGSLLVGLAGLALASLVVRVLDSASLRFLGRARFWVFGLFLGAGGGLFLGRNPVDVAMGGWEVSVSVEGLAAGALMVVRSAALLLAVVVTARHLPRQRLGSIAARLGMAPLGPALAVAVDLLPGLQRRWRNLMPAGGGSGRGRVRVLLGAATDLVTEVAITAGEVSWIPPNQRDDPGAQPARPLLFVVTGVTGSGKTRYLQEVVERATQRGQRVGGVLQPRRAEPAGHRDSYLVRELSGGDECLLVSFPHGRPVFRPEGFTLASRGLESSLAAQLVVVDELGNQEAGGAGHWPSLQALLDGSPPAALLVSVARQRLDELLPRLPAAGEPQILDLDDPGSDPEGFAGLLLRSLPEP